MKYRHIFLGIFQSIPETQFHWLLGKFDIIHFQLKYIPNKVFYGNKTTYICYNPISPQICFDSPVCQDFMKIFYLPNVFVKIVKVNKTNQNMFESSHKTSLVSKICTIVKSCISYALAFYSQIAAKSLRISHVCMKIHNCSQRQYQNCNLAVLNYSQLLCTVNGCNSI